MFWVCVPMPGVSACCACVRCPSVPPLPRQVSPHPHPALRYRVLISACLLCFQLRLHTRRTLSMFFVSTRMRGACSCFALCIPAPGARARPQHPAAPRGCARTALPRLCPPSCVSHPRVGGSAWSWCAQPRAGMSSLGPNTSTEGLDIRNVRK